MLIGPRSRWLLMFTCIALILGSSQKQFAQTADSSPAQLTVPQIVDQMVKRNAERASALKSYRGRRLYKLDYVGFPAHFHAEMQVEMKYDAPSSKQFTVVSQSGDKWVIDHIFKRLLDTEKEAVEGDNWKKTALDHHNYNFSATSDDHPDKLCPYVLAVEPKVASKLLFEGKVWVNAKDFAVCRIEAEPSKNPSFWIKQTNIHHAYLKVGDFWLPQENISVSSLRLGGRATLTINYQDYEILNPATQPEKKTEEAPHAADAEHK